MTEKFFFKGACRAQCTIIGAAKADAAFLPERNLTCLKVATREVYTSRDGASVEQVREVPLYISGSFQAAAGDIIAASGTLTLAEAKGEAKYPVLFEVIHPESVENMGPGSASLRGVNQAELIGRIGKIRPISAGQNAGLAVSIAVTRKGETEQTDWHDCTFWGRRAENAQKILGIGDLVLVSGFLNSRAVKVGQAQKNILTFMPADFTVLHKKQQNGQKAGAAAGAPAPADAFAADPMF